MSPKRKPKKPTKPVTRWAQKFRAAFRRDHLRLRGMDEVVTKLAGLVTMVGDFDDPDARRVYGALVSLFGREQRQSRWGQAIDEIPATEEALKRIAACVKAYRNEIAKRGGRGLSRAHINLPEVLSVMSQVRNPEGYVRDCRKGGLTRAGAVFHPNTFDNAKEKFRGVYSRDSGERDDYREEVKRRFG